jgi:hypothetical protein
MHTDTAFNPKKIKKDLAFVLSDFANAVEHFRYQKSTSAISVGKPSLFQPDSSLLT